MSTHFVFTLNISVHEERKLRRAAARRAREEGDLEHDAYLDREAKSVSDCLRMMLDPNEVEGCTVLDAACCEAST